MGHGNHWHAIDPGREVDDLVAEMLPKVLTKGTGLGLRGRARVHADSPRQLESDRDIVYILGPADVAQPRSPVPIGILTIEAAFPESKTFTLQSAFPFMRDGFAALMRIVRADEWCGTVEGIIEAEPLTASPETGPRAYFFDPFFATYRHRYTPGSVHTFSLAALAYRLGLAEPEVENTDPKMIQIFRERALQDDPNADISGINSVTISLSGAAIYVSTDDWPEDAAFRGPVESVRYISAVDVLGVGFWALQVRIACGLDSEAALRVIVYASEHVAHGYTPRVGDDVGGSFWLTGHLGLSAP